MITIRTAELADVPALVSLLGQLFEQEAEFAPDTSANAQGLAAIISSPDVGTILVATEGGRVVGLINLLYTISTALGGRVALLEDVVVDRSRRGQGIGKRLIATAIEHARQAGILRVTLLTDPDNARAHALYRSFGFARSAMVPYRLALERRLMA